jgi:hypothetical protein
MVVFTAASATGFGIGFGAPLKNELAETTGRNTTKGCGPIDLRGTEEGALSHEASKRRFASGASTVLLRRPQLGDPQGSGN